MLTYNTQLKRLILPEYGRNIQKMVDYCLTIADRDERSHCARSIILSMGNLFPELRSPETHDRKLWDHLVIMSDFKLDVDFPCEVITAESLQTLPQPVSRQTVPVKYHHYGRDIVRMLEKAAEMEEGPERDALVALLANQMKKVMLTVNKDGVDDERIFKDIAVITSGRIRIEPGTIQLYEFKELQQPAGKKKKKK